MINSIDNDVAKEIFSLIGSHSWSHSLQATTARKTISISTISQTKECSGTLMSALQPETGDFKDCHVECKLNERIICLNVINRKSTSKGSSPMSLSVYAEHVEINYFENPYSPGWHWMTVYDRKATKEYAIKEL